MRTLVCRQKNQKRISNQKNHFMALSTAKSEHYILGCICVCQKLSLGRKSKKQPSQLSEGVRVALTLVGYNFQPTNVLTQNLYVSTQKGTHTLGVCEKKADSASNTSD